MLYLLVCCVGVKFHYFTRVLDLVDMLVDEPVMQETMTVVKPCAVILLKVTL